MTFVVDIACTKFCAWKVCLYIGATSSATFSWIALVFNQLPNHFGCFGHFCPQRLVVITSTYPPTPINLFVVNQLMKLMHYSTHDQQYKQYKNICSKSTTEVGGIVSSSYWYFTNISRRALFTVIALVVLLYISAVKRSMIGNAKSSNSFDGKLQRLINLSVTSG